jgi:dihydroxyacetone kinase-like protein
MKKLINHPQHYVDESLEGMCLAFSGYRKHGRVIARAHGAAKGKVGVVTGGGFGHLPVFAGYVANGMLSACAVGDVFAGPPVDVCGEAIREADGGAGVLCVLGNYGGDRMSFAQAVEEFEDVGGRCATVIVADDVASASKAERAKRRGVAGMVFAF